MKKIEKLVTYSDLKWEKNHLKMWVVQIEMFLKVLKERIKNQRKTGDMWKSKPEKQN